MEELLTMVGNYGFPMVCCVCLFLLLNKQTATFNELKVVMERILDRLGGKDNE